MSGLGYGIAAVTFQLIGGAVSKVIPDRQIATAIIGGQATGKSTFGDLIDNEFAPQNHNMGHVPTLSPGGLKRTRVYLEDAPFVFRDYRRTQWLHEDYPHFAEEVRAQVMKVMPEIVFWILAADSWEDPYNLQVASALADVLSSREYRRLTSPTVSWQSRRKKWVGQERGARIVKTHQKGGRRRVKYIVIVVNKMDLWEDLGPTERAKKCREVLTHYFQNCPEMAFLKTSFDIRYIAASFLEGNYLSWQSLTAPPEPLDQYFTKMVKAVVVKKK